MEIGEIHLNTIDSTNTYAKTHAENFAADKITCITAEEQTAGRGRYQRKWTSPRGVNLYTTFYFCLPISTLHLISLAQVMAYSLTALLLREGLDPKIKWPNDIQLHGKKVSGILCETIFRSKDVQIILGIGINVNMSPEALATIDQPATSLKNETHREWDRKDLLKKLQKQFVSDLETFKEKGFAPFHDLFEKRLALKGQTIRCFDGKKEWVGICHSVSSDGQLNLLLENQTLHTLRSGDIEKSD